MKILFKDGASSFVADAQVNDYKRMGWHEAWEGVCPPPADGLPDDGTPDDGMQDLNPEENPPVPDDAGGDPFTCPVCGKEYARKASLDKHIAEKHPEV